MASKVRPPLPDGPFLVVGMARSGSAVAAMLAGRGETVAGCDSGNPPIGEDLAEAGVEVHLETDGVELLAAATTVVKSPGVPAEAPIIRAAREQGKEVVGELELAWRASSGRFTAITGTNGKTTVTQWVGYALAGAGREAIVAGNVGTPLAAVAERSTDESEVVCECSSFQLEDSIAFAPEAAVLLNISADHLDRHGTLEAYRDAKLRIFANQSQGDVAIWDADDELIAAGQIPGAGERMPFGSAGAVDSDATDLLADGEPLLPLAELPLPGAHNVRNAMAVASACIAAGLEREQVAAGLRGFPGIRHRLERIAERDGVLFVNDSKATNVAAAAAALESFDRPVRAILGGSLKGGGFRGLRRPVSERCAAAYLTGEASAAIAADLEGIETPLIDATDFDDAVRRARDDADRGDVVLLAPACASFDEFSSFEERGDRFAALIRGED